MKSKDELKEIYNKNDTAYYFDVIIRFWDRDIDFSDVLSDKKLYQENNVLGSIKQTDLLKFIIKLDIQYYLIMGGLIKFVIRLNIL